MNGVALHHAVAKPINYLSPEVVVLGVEQPDESGVDGALVGHLERAVDQDLQDLGLVRGEVGLEDRGQALQVALQGGGTLRRREK